MDLVSILIRSISLASAQVENLDTFQGHGGAISGLVCREGVPEFLTVSEDRSLRCWTWKTGTMTVSSNSFHVRSHDQRGVTFQKVLVHRGAKFQLCASLHWVTFFSLAMSPG